MGIDLSHSFKGKAVARLLKQWVLLLAASAMLAGCASGFERWRNDQARAKAEIQHAHTEVQERDNYTLCVNQGAMPGTAENLACQLALTKKQQPPVKPQSPAAKAP